MKILNVKGRDVKLDDDWYEMFKFVPWFVTKSNYIARRWYSSDGRKGNEYMHNIIMDRHTSFIENDSLIVDHINNDMFDNQVKNLRKVTYSINSFNRKKSNIRNLPRGVYERSNGTFYSQIRNNGKCYHLGTFENINDACIARKKAENEIFKEESK